MKVVEDVLLGVAHTVAVPLLALFATAAKVGNDVDAARLDPREDRCGEGGSQGNAEPAVAVEDGGYGSGRRHRDRRITNIRTSVPSLDW